MRLMKAFAALAMAMLLASCGGGGCNAGSSPLTGTSACTSGSTADPTTPAAQTIDVVASSVVLKSGTAAVTVSAIVKGAGNVSLPDTAVTFSTSSGTLSAVSAKTDSSGIATAKLSEGADKTNRTITVTVKSGSATGTLNVDVQGTSLAVSGATTVPLGNKATLTVKATDSNGSSVSGAAVSVSSSLGNTLSRSSLTTDASGTATVDYTAVTSGNDTVTFTGAGATSTTAIQVSGENFVFISPTAGTAIPVGTSATVTVRYLQNGVPQANKQVNFAATAGTVTPSSVVTDASGNASATVSALTASPATVQATLVGLGAQATLPVQFVALTPTKVVLQVTPTAVAPNPAGATTSSADLVATVTDANANPVAGQTVNFTRITDPSGGNLSQASAVTNSSGQATIQYIPGALATASNGVAISATVAGTAISGTATLTVNQSALFIALGTGNVISNIDPQTYKKDWVIYVTDANGVAVPNINLTVKVLPLSYGKGVLSYTGGVWTRDYASFTCANEDQITGNPSLDFNGILDPGEDFNGNGTLEPGNVISVSPGTIRSDSTGRATISLIYAESYAPWVDVKLRVEAVVSGTESSKEASFTVEGLASDFTDQKVAPAGVISPFGRNACNLPN